MILVGACLRLSDSSKNKLYKTLYSRSTNVIATVSPYYAAIIDRRGGFIWTLLRCSSAMRI